MAGNEFDLINHFFKTQPVSRKDVELGIGDDAAVISVPANSQLVVTTDTLVAGNHFLPEADPVKVAHKALASNLSDLAAMGAIPAWCSLALTLPSPDEAWLKGFCDGFYKLAEYYQVQLVGGDTTKGPLSITITMQGFIPKGKAIRRDGAKAGDWLYVTGNLGDSAAGLEVILQGNEPSSDSENTLLNRHYYSTPRVLAGQALREIASSALDISDGLVADLKHILKASQVGAVINAEDLPLSDALLDYVGNAEKAAKLALCSGEEYELCFTVPESHRGALDAALAHTNTTVTCIGQIRHGDGLQVLWKQKPVDWTLSGWDHFSE
ncbi:thiamine-phosphate kinase [Enterovibrio sp. ZSDZ35]|uniref:Thiamine-monophosphate kinase n=1 Tax=Enterovibrio qingdaonensis TaxID=2899818 RepID=A0ABT5QR70_9GAMM|nr:thiamine-phosphate kinase [Enterovibrio sp. ZSDZ35]MDD1783475.1 thiamine-phosphate kinase [Enterovibrio sp. ZSDZ35]